FELGFIKLQSRRESHLRWEKWEKSQLAEEKVVREEDHDFISKRSERFRSEDVIEMKKNDVHIQ
ncbi:hypothetical protein Tco_0473328, partial [Tanacetum coccineum]